MVAAEARIAARPGEALHHRVIPATPDARRRPRTSRGVRPQPQAAWRSLALVVSATVLALAITARASTLAQLGYKVASLKQTLAAAENENRRLALEIARLTELGRIERIAVAELGMVRPEAVRLVAGGPRGAPEAWATARRARDPAADLAAGETWWRQLGGWLARLLEGVRPADASTR